MNVIYILRGPSYDTDSLSFQKKYIELSRFFSGFVFSTSDRKISTSMNQFCLRTCAYEDGFIGNIRYAFFCFYQLFKLIKMREKIQLVVTYDPIKTGLIGCLFKYLLGAKLAVEVNGVYSSPYVFEGHEKCNKIKIKKAIYSKIIKFVLNRSDGIKLLYPEQIDYYNIDTRNKIVTSYFDWVDIDRFKEIECRKEILFVGFPYKIKGVDILIQAFKRIANKYPDWNLVILGWYPDRTILDAEIDGHPQIFYRPPVSYSEMPDHIGRCGFLVLPSRTEAMGRVLIEAMAAGKARIGSRIDGIPTVIDDGVDGLLVPPEDVDSLAEKMELLIVDSSLRDELGDNGRVRAFDEFNNDKYLNYTFDFYEKVKNRNI